jgi:hypothetical protein
LHFFGLLDFEVANVFNRVAKLLDARLQARAAKGRGAHVDAAATLAEVHGYADDSDFLRHVNLMFRDPWPASHKETESHTTRKHARGTDHSKSQYKLRARDAIAAPYYAGLRIHAINHAWKGDDFPDVFRAANPGDGAFEAKTEARVGNAAIAAQVEIPLERFLGQVVFTEAF